MTLKPGSCTASIHLSRLMLAFITPGPIEPLVVLVAKTHFLYPKGQKYTKVLTTHLIKLIYLILDLFI